MTRAAHRPRTEAQPLQTCDALTARRGPNLNETFDYAEALRRVEGDSGFLGEIAADFIQDCPDTLSRLRDALARRDRDALAFSAHKMKGALATLSAGPARAAATLLEEASSGEDLSAAAEALRALEGRLDALVPALRALQARFGPE
jgi:HPt (histidine-containing phosphotransfer) domain-containing protein